MMQVIVDGLVSASYVSLGVVGLSLIYNILNFANFAIFFSFLRSPS